MFDRSQIYAIDATRNQGRDALERAWRPMPKISDPTYTANYFQPESVWVQVLGDIRSLGQKSPPCTDFMPLKGNWGKRREKPSVPKVDIIDPEETKVQEQLKLRPLESLYLS